VAAGTLPVVAGILRAAGDILLQAADTNLPGEVVEVVDTSPQAAADKTRPAVDSEDN